MTASLSNRPEPRPDVQTPSVLFWNQRWGLASLTRNDLIRIGLVSAMVGLGYMLFHYQGNTSDIRAFGRSVLLWMYTRWADSSASFSSTDYSHGFLIPLVAAWVVWYRRRDLWAAPKHVSWMGLIFLIAALTLHWVGAKAQHPRLSLVSIIGILWSVPFYLYGWQVAKILMFPCAYLIFCVPLNFLDDLTSPLQLAMIRSSSAILNGLGVEVTHSGTTLFVVRSGYDFDVAAPCSGLRSLLAMMALTSVYAYVTLDVWWKKWLLFFSSIPLAVVGNMARITSIVLVAEVAGPAFAMERYHDPSGYVVFVVAILLMVALGGLLDADWKWKEVWTRWRSHLFNPTASSSG